MFPVILLVPKESPFFQERNTCIDKLRTIISNLYHTNSEHDYAYLSSTLTMFQPYSSPFPSLANFSNIYKSHGHSIILPILNSQEEVSFFSLYMKINEHKHRILPNAKIVNLFWWNSVEKSIKHNINFLAI